MFAEDLTIVTLLGFRFMDAATEQQITDGLTVRARREDGGGRVVKAKRSPSGHYAFPDVPGLHDFQYPDDASALDSVGSPPFQINYIVEVRDALRRYLPAAKRIALPLPPTGSPPARHSLRDFYLVSAPNRPVPPGMAVLYTQLADASTREPAPHAVMEVDVDGETVFGMADQEGRIAVLFPYPTVVVTLSGSPPSGSAPILSQHWDLTYRIRCQPSHLQRLSGAGLPDLDSIYGQDFGRIQKQPDASPPVPPVDDGTALLTFGQPAVLTTAGDARLFIEPAP